MKLVNIERVVVNNKEYETLTNALEILDEISLCGDNETSEFASVIAERITLLQNMLLVCEEDDNGAFVTFTENEVTDFIFDDDCDCIICESEEE